MIDADEPDVTAEDFYEALLDDDPAELYEHAPCAYLSMLPDGTVVKLNQTFSSWTGHERAQLVGRTRLQDLLPPGPRIHYETHLAPLLRMQGRVREIATEIVCADGTRLPVLLNAVGKHAADGTPLTYRIALFDARERRSYERELLAALRRAEAAEARARSLAETLQSSFLPPELLGIDGLEVAGAYRPAGDGSEVGGDFYDVFETGRGSYAVALGDVMGKGADAAAITSLARYTIRAEAVRTDSPAAVLAVVNEVLLRFPTRRFCTALLLFVDRVDGWFQVRIAVGGHPLPVLVRGGEIARVGRLGTALGILDEAPVHEAEVALVSGDLLVLFTDGVTEARHEGAFLGDEGLDALLREVDGRGARATVEGIVERVVGMQHGWPRDDIALVALAPT